MDTRTGWQFPYEKYGSLAKLNKVDSGGQPDISMGNPVIREDNENYKGS